MLLTARGVTKDYKNVQALSAVDITVAKNEFVCLIGPNGSGKSTLLRMMAGILQPTAGTIETSARAAYLPQQSSLLPWRTVAQNLLLPAAIGNISADITEARVHKTLKRFDLHAFADVYPHALSGGMQQKVALLRTVLMKPGLMLLDEPFSALDAITRAQMQVWLLDLWQTTGSGAVCVTHDVREAILLADTIYVLTRRPGSVKKKIEVKLPRRRRQAYLHSAEAKKLEKQLTKLLEVDL